jgi:hypothetical protein
MEAHTVKPNQISHPRRLRKSCHKRKCRRERAYAAVQCRHSSTRSTPCGIHDRCVTVLRSWVRERAAARVQSCSIDTRRRDKSVARSVGCAPARQDHQRCIVVRLRPVQASQATASAGCSSNACPSTRVASRLSLRSVSVGPSIDCRCARVAGPEYASRSAAVRGRLSSKGSRGVGSQRTAAHGPEEPSLEREPTVEDGVV